MKFKILDSSFGNNAQYKRKFSFLELYLSYLYAPRALSKLSRNKKEEQINQYFIKRIQLAVREVK